MSITLERMASGISGCLIDNGSRAATWPIHAAAARDDGCALHSLPPAQQAWLKTTGWKARAGSHALLPGEGGMAGAVLGLGEETAGNHNPLLPGILPAALPEGDYHFAFDPADAQLASLAWAMGAYAFRRYLGGEERGRSRLKLPQGVSKDAVISIAQAIWLARELINTPSNDMGPAELEDCVRHVAQHFKADVKVIEGPRLLSDNFPLIHAVGRASDRMPRLIDLTWGGREAAKVTLVGKGICFDTGGLNIKPGLAMGLMKKDMGGAAAVIALGAMIMAAQLPLRLRILIPAADNNISANAFRPGDIIKSRDGMTVEIANTDAEGRLVLADALSLADEEAPDYLIDIATLTGAARVALGPDLPPFYTDDDEFAAGLMAAASRVADPVWRLPFWAPYDSYLKSKVADVNHVCNGPYAGSITAALFLRRFVKKAKRFAHLDIYGWTPRTLPGKPQGGEPQTARALFELLSQRFRRDT